MAYTGIYLYHYRLVVLVCHIFLSEKIFQFHLLSLPSYLNINLYLVCFIPLAASSVCHTVLYAWVPLVTSSRAFLEKTQDTKCLVILNLLGKLSYQHIMFTWFGNQPMRVQMVWRKSKASPFQLQVQNATFICTVHLFGRVLLKT